MQKVILLLNYPSSKNYWFNHIFKNREVLNYGISNFTMKLRYSKVFSIINFTAKFILAFKGVIRSKPDDILIVWDNTYTGIMCGLISYILKLKRNILLLNMIDHGSNKFLKKIKKTVFSTAFKKIHATVNSTELIEFYTTEYKIPINRLFELQDTFAGFGDFIINNEKRCENPKYDVFCGGSSHRNWQLFIDVAKTFPNKKFVGVARKKQFDNKLIYPENVEFYFDVDYTFFIDTLYNSAICLLPLRTTSQAGQIVIFQAGLLKKPVIITETVAIKKYISNYENGILVAINDKDQTILELKKLLSDKGLQQKLGDNLNNDIRKFSQEEFSLGLNKIIDDVFGRKN